MDKIFVILNKDEMSSCNSCLDRHTWAQTIININGLTIKLCKHCKKELMKQLIDIT